MPAKGGGRVPALPPAYGSRPGRMTALPGGGETSGMPPRVAPCRDRGAPHRIHEQCGARAVLGAESRLQDAPPRPAGRRARA